MSVKLVGAVALACLVMEGRPVDAEPVGSNYFAETHYDVGVQTVSDFSFGGASASGTGVHLTEHNGLIARAIAYIPTAIGVIQASGDTKFEKTEGMANVEVNHVDSRGNTMYKTNERMPVFVITARSLTSEEKAARDAHIDRMNAGYAMLVSHPMHFELLYLPNRDDGHVHGIRAAFMPLAIGIGQHVEIATGYTGARMKIDSMEGGVMRTVKHRMRGMPFRLGVIPARWLVLTAEYHLNFLHFTHDDQEADYSSTVRMTAAISIPHVDRFYAKLGAERIGMSSSGTWNTFVEGGMRF